MSKSISKLSHLSPRVEACTWISLSRAQNVFPSFCGIWPGPVVCACMRSLLRPRGGWLLVSALLVTCQHPSVWEASAQSCCDAKTASALAVSITFSVCQGNIVLAAETLAQASATGCGDAYAAGVGVGVANLAPTGPGGLDSVVTNAFSSALSASLSSGSAVAVAQGLAVALASATPCESFVPGVCESFLLHLPPVTIICELQPSCPSPTCLSTLPGPLQT